MVVAVFALAVLLLLGTLAMRRSRRAARARHDRDGRHGGRNVVSLDAYRAARMSGRAIGSFTATTSLESQYQQIEYQLSASSAGGLRTVRQPDGRLARPSARPEPA
jgi:hypothetical protein